MSDSVQPLTPAQTAAQEQKAEHEPWAERALVADDKAIAANLLDAPPDVTISEQAGVLAEEYPKGGGLKGFYGRWMSRFLDIFQKDHGAKATAGGNAEAEEAIEYGDKSGLLNKEGK